MQPSGNNPSGWLGDEAPLSSVKGGWLRPARHTASQRSAAELSPSRPWRRVNYFHGASPSKIDDVIRSQQLIVATRRRLVSSRLAR